MNVAEKPSDDLVCTGAAASPAKASGWAGLNLMFSEPGCLRKAATAAENSDDTALSSFGMSLISAVTWLTTSVRIVSTSPVPPNIGLRRGPSGR